MTFWDKIEHTIEDLPEAEAYELMVRACLEELYGYDEEETKRMVEGYGENGIGVKRIIEEHPIGTHYDPRTFAEDIQEAKNKGLLSYQRN